MLCNLVKSIKNVGLIDDFKFYPIDKEIYNTLHNDLDCELLEDIARTEDTDYIGYGNNGFKDITLFKNRIMQHSLHQGNNTLLVDTDIMFISNPMELLNKYIEDHDVLFQTETYFNKNKRKFNKTEVNTGFIYAKPEEDVIKLFDYNRGDETAVKTQQFLINWRIKTYKKQRWYPSLPQIQSDLDVNYGRLPIFEFPTWVTYTNSTEEQQKKAKILHYNDTSSITTKIDRMMSNKHWV